MKLGIIGCGKMGTALVGGAVRSGVLAPAEIAGFDPFPEALESFARATGAGAAESLAALVADSERLLLCVRPQDVPEVLEGVGRATVDPVPLISIAAGITTGTLERGLPVGSRVIRVMPNTPALVDKGAAAYCAGTHATEEDIAFASRLLESVGLAMKVDESLMDTVTGLSGSGPAFVFLMIEALADGGVNCGLTRAQALRLSAQTVLGAAAMVLETGEHPAILRDKVASPGGTTIAGLAELERRGLRAALIYAVDVAARKSKNWAKAEDATIQAPHSFRCLSPFRRLAKPAESLQPEHLKLQTPPPFSRFLLTSRTMLACSSPRISWERFKALRVERFGLPGVSRKKFSAPSTLRSPESRKTR